MPTDTWSMSPVAELPLQIRPIGMELLRKDTGTPKPPVPRSLVPARVALRWSPVGSSVHRRPSTLFLKRNLGTAHQGHQCRIRHGQLGRPGSRGDRVAEHLRTRE